MNLTLNIDDGLLQQARRISGAASDRELLERGLLALIKQISQTPRQPVLKNIGKVSAKFTPVSFEAPDMPTLYHGPALSLADMDTAVLAEAARHK
jgi:hypothetical protein